MWTLVILCTLCAVVNAEWVNQGIDLAGHTITLRSKHESSRALYSESVNSVEFATESQSLTDDRDKFKVIFNFFYQYTIDVSNMFLF